MRQVVAYERLKSMARYIINRQAQKAVEVSYYSRWCFARGSNCNAVTGKILVFWIGGRLWEVVAHGSSTVYINHYFNETAHRANGSLIKILFSTVLYL